jgi:multidrug efflux system membrane fusion protein
MSNEDRALARSGTPAWREPATAATSIRRTIRGRWVWLVALLAIGAIVAERIHTNPAPASSRSAPPVVPVVTAIAHQQDVPVYLDGLGSVTAYNTVTIRTRVDFQLDRVDFREGQLVRPGDLLAEIDPRPFQVQLDQANGQLARDQAQLENAKALLKRYQELWSEDSVAKQDLDAQAASVGQLEGAVKSDRAAIAAAQLNLTYSRIRAPIGGRIGLRLVDPGNVVHAADTNGIVVLTQLAPIAVVFTLPEDALPNVRAAMARDANLPVDAYDRQGRIRLASGRLLTLDNRIDPTTGTFRVKAVFENKDSALFPDQFVNTRVLVDTQRGRVVVPSVAVQRGAQGPFLYTVGPDHVAHLRTVKTGITHGDDTVVLSGVKSGDPVVVEGADRLREGTRVDVRSQDTRRSPAGT